jgi:putative Holliday junction resolvase
MLGLKGMRVLGVDFGTRRIGLALSDRTAVLARPWRALDAGRTPQASAEAVARLIGRARAVAPGAAAPLVTTGEDDEASDVGAIVVGLPRRLNGTDTDQTQPAREFAAALATLTGLDVRLQDERLSSREAESRLAVREKDWRRRKARLDAASAAIILQDYLDAAAGPGGQASL